MSKTFPSYYYEFVLVFNHAKNNYPQCYNQQHKHIYLRQIIQLDHKRSNNYGTWNFVLYSCLHHHVNEVNNKKEFMGGKYSTTIVMRFLFYNAALLC